MNEFGDKDVQAKLEIAQNKVKEAQAKLQAEQQARKEVDRQLALTKHGMGGSDLEFQLMQNLVQLRARCAELEANDGAASKEADQTKTELEQMKKEKKKL